MFHNSLLGNRAVNIPSQQQKRCFLCGPCGVYIRKACVADRSRQDWRVNWRTESSKIRRRMSVFVRFIHSESVIVKTSGKRLSRLAWSD
jgi:hypothetical protein